MAEKLKIAPDICSCMDENNNMMNVEICIPGVKRDDIKLRMNDNYLNLSAPREDFDYTAAASFCAPVKSKEAQASYQKGLLKICVPLKGALDPSRDVTVS